MATAAGKVRQRAWKPKNRTGCKTCKIRKVKCDEEKPNCNRCTSTGRKCDGYDPTFRPPQSTSPPSSTHLTVYGGHNSSVGNGVIRSPSPSYLAPALRFSTVEERESFDFFTSHAVMSLRGFLDSPFWQREVLQAAHQDQAIRHCVVALGAMHRRFYEGGGSHINEQDMTDAYLQFALRQSNQAIQDLIRKQNSNGKIGKSDKVTLMTCSILFSSMACLQGHQKDALDHLKSGIRMLNEMDDEENDKKVDHAIDMNSLRSIFVGLDMLARSIMPTSQSRSWVARPKSNAISTLPKAELNMSSLLEMLRYMESLLNNIHSFFQGFDLRPPEEVNNIVLDYSDLIIQFHRGGVILDALCDKATPNGEFSQPLTALRLLQCQMEYLLRSPNTVLELKFDFISKLDGINNMFGEPFDATAQLIQMFELATKLLPLTSATTPVFTTTVGPLSALWLVAMRAPSTCAALRKRAVRLMLSHPRREGFWDGMVAGQIAQEALRLEYESTVAELGLSSSPDHDLIIPNDLRMISVSVSYVEDDDRKARVEYFNGRDMATGSPGAVQWITW